MSKFEQNDLSGALFKNDKKGNDRAPDYKGNAKIDGVEMWVSAWIKESRNGDKYLSLAFQPKEQDYRASAGINNPDGSPKDDDLLNDEIPF